MEVIGCVGRVVEVLGCVGHMVEVMGCVAATWWQFLGLVVCVCVDFCYGLWLLCEFRD